jgi:tetratricopeptide (TPR) repeat protein
MNHLLMQRYRFLVKLAMVEESLAAINLAIEHAKMADDIDDWITAQLALGTILWRHGRYKAAREQTEIAFQLSQQTNTELIKTRIIVQQGIIHSFLGNYIQARQSYEQALRRLQADGVGGLSIIAMYANLGAISIPEEKFTEARKYLEQALDMYRQIGSSFGEGMMFGYLSTLAFHEQRYMTALALAQRAVDAMRETGEVVREASALVTLGDVYTRLGQWETAQKHYEQALALSRPVHNKNTETEALINLALLTYQLGDFQESLSLSKQAIQLTEGSGVRHLHASALTGQGRALESLGQIEEALDCYIAALALRHEMNQLNLISELRALLARLHLNQGDLKQTKTYIEDVLAHLGFPTSSVQNTPSPFPSIQQLNGVQEPFRVYLICYQILEANNDERSATVLNFAIHHLKQQAEQIDSPNLRQSFLENVPLRRQILSIIKN